MSSKDETTRFHGRYVTFAGRTMFRAAGGEIDAQEEAAPVAESAAPGETEAPAGPPEGYVEQSRYDNLRAEQNRKQALWDRAQQGDLDAMRELKLPLQFEDDTEPEEDEEPAFRDPRLDALLQEREQERQAKQQEEGWNRFNSDLDQVAKGKKLSDDDRLVIYTKTLQAGGAPDALAQAYGDFAKERAAYDQAVIDAFLESKRAPHVSPGGTGATKTPFREDMSLDERIAAAQEQARLISG